MNVALSSSRQVPELDSPRLRPLHCLHRIRVLTLSLDYRRWRPCLPCYFDRLGAKEQPFPSMLNIPLGGVPNHDRYHLALRLPLNPAAVHIYADPSSPDVDGVLACAPIFCAVPDPGEWTNVTSVTATNILPVFLTRNPLILRISPSTRPDLHTIVDLRGLTVNQRATWPKVWPRCQPYMDAGQERTDSFEVWLSSEEDKVAAEKMLEEEGWPVVKGKTVLVKEDDA